MSRKPWLVAAVLICFGYIPVCVWACDGHGGLDGRPLPELIADLATSASDYEVDGNSETVEALPAEQVQLILALRRHGQPAVDALVAYRDSWGSRPGEVNERQVIQRLEDLIDRVAGQRHATSSKLFWHTSMKRARQIAETTGRPILSLRLLGRLDEDFSCANSRYFRTTLYPDPEVSRQLREQFVLHWAPVRDVPRVTIDMGDGRKLQRTLTGNSVHLVLDGQGRPIDALPGLVSHEEFSKWLSGASELWTQIEDASPREAQAKVAQYHRRQADHAREQSPLAIKLDQAVADLDPNDRRWVDAAADFRLVGLSNAAAAVVAKDLPAEVAMPIAYSKGFVETPLLRMVKQVNENVARDTAFNLYALKPKIDDWFAAAKTSDLAYEALTNRIYAEVFLMPLSDPWLGLSPRNQFVALPNAGRVQPESAMTTQRLLSGINAVKE